MTVKLLTEPHFEVLCLKGGCTGLIESTLVKMPRCWSLHDAAEISIYALKRTLNSVRANENP